MFNSVLKIATLIFLVTFSLSYAQSIVKTGEMIISTSTGELLGADASSYNSIIPQSDQLEWEVYVPENYNPENPPGIMVYAGSPQDVRPPGSWMSVMEDKNLIWVAARKSGNGSSFMQKELVALLSVPLIEKDYKIDADRVYITGEGRIASVVTMDNPDIFKGAILSGTSIWSKNPESKINAILDKRFVFVTSQQGGAGAVRTTRHSYYKFKDAGVKNLKLITVYGRHRYDRRKFSQSIDYLDG